MAWKNRIKSKYKPKFIIGNAELTRTIRLNPDKEKDTNNVPEVIRNLEVNQAADLKRRSITEQGSQAIVIATNETLVSEKKTEALIQLQGGNDRHYKKGSG